MASRYKVIAVTSYEGMEDLAQKINSALEQVHNGLKDIKLYESLSDRPYPGQGKARINSALIIVDTASK